MSRLARILGIVIVVVVACTWAAPAWAYNVYFSETFDGAALPGTLTYTNVAPNLVWSLDTVNQRLVADSDGTLNTSIRAISNAGFTSPDMAVIYSLDVGIPTGSSAGSYNVGIEFGGYQAVFHPGYAPIPGAFRMGGGFSTGNTNMGFVPAMGEMHHMEVETLNVGTALAVDITISGLGTDGLMHEFNYSFIDTSPNLNTGTIGARRSGGGASSDAFFDNLEVQIAPEPATMALVGVGLLALVRRKRR